MGRETNSYLLMFRETLTNWGSTLRLLVSIVVITGLTIGVLNLLPITIDLGPVQLRR